MTIKKFRYQLKDIDENTEILSDSGWECDPTDINKIVYSKQTNKVILLQYFDENKTLDYYNNYYNVNDFMLIDNGNPPKYFE